MGNIVADNNKIANIDIDVKLDFNYIIGRYLIFSISRDELCMIRTIVVHEKEDDLGRGDGDSKNTGNAGGRLDCCVINGVPVNNASVALLLTLCSIIKYFI